MRVDPTAIPPRDAYRWLIGLITPRPIAWVSTISPDGVPNLAPFSFFNGITSNPPSLLFCASNDRHGRLKDTVRNVEATREFVVNVVDDARGAAMVATSAALPYGESEFAATGLATAPGEVVRPPRVALAPASLECVLHDIVRVGSGPGAGNVVIGLVRLIHVRDDVLGPDGLPDPARLDTIGRMGGDGYCRTREVFEIARP